MSAPTATGSFAGQAAALHERILVIDGHLDLPFDLDAEIDLRALTDSSEFDLEKTRRGGVAGAVLAITANLVSPRDGADEKGRREQQRRHQLVLNLAQSAEDSFGIAHSPEQFRELAASGRFAGILGYQNAHPLGDRIDAIAEWAERGIQLFGFTFIGSNQWADSARPYPWVKPTKFGGLSQLGIQAVERLNDLGVIVDASQLSSEAFADLIEHTRAPVVASHSGVQGLVDLGRNMTDGELAAIGENGGVVNIVAFGPYTRRPTDQMITELEQTWRKYGLEPTGQLADLLSINDPATADWDDEKFLTFLHEFHVVLDLENPSATVGDLVDNIDYAVKHAGIDHVGIASDFNHGGGLADWTSLADTPNVTAELLRRGYSDADIAKLWGENFLRAWGEVKAAAKGAAS